MKPSPRRMNDRRSTEAQRTHARFWRTSSILAAVIIALAEEIPSTSLTVSEIVREAGVNRSTFYTHSENPTSLLPAALRAALVRREESVRLDDDPRGRFETAVGVAVAHVNAHATVYRTSLADSAAAGALFSDLPDSLTLRLEALTPTDSTIVAAAIAGATVEVIKHQLVAGSPEPTLDQVIAVLSAALRMTRSMTTAPVA